MRERDFRGDCPFAEMRRAKNAMLTLRVSRRLCSSFGRRMGMRHRPNRWLAHRVIKQKRIIAWTPLLALRDPWIPKTNSPRGATVRMRRYFERNIANRMRNTDRVSALGTESAPVAKLVYACALGAHGDPRAGSSPVWCTKTTKLRQLYNPDDYVF